MTETATAVRVTLAQAFGARVHRRRDELDVSLEALTAATDIDRGHLCVIEAGLAEASLSEATVLAQALDTTVGALLGEPADPRSDRADWSTATEWTVFVGGTDPDSAVYARSFTDPERADDMLPWLRGGQVARRQVAYGPRTVGRSVREVVAGA